MPPQCGSDVGGAMMSSGWCGGSDARNPRFDDDDRWSDDGDRRGGGGRKGPTVEEAGAAPTGDPNVRTAEDEGRGGGGLERRLINEEGAGLAALAVLGGVAVVAREGDVGAVETSPSLVLFAGESNY
jgi:hypothetical protein